MNFFEEEWKNNSMAVKLNSREGNCLPSILLVQTHTHSQTQRQRDSDLTYNRSFECESHRCHSFVQIEEKIGCG